MLEPLAVEIVLIEFCVVTQRHKVPNPETVLAAERLDLE